MAPTARDIAVTDVILLGRLRLRLLRAEDLSKLSIASLISFIVARSVCRNSTTQKDPETVSMQQAAALGKTRQRYLHVTETPNINNLKTSSYIDLTSTWNTAHDADLPRLVSWYVTRSISTVFDVYSRNATTQSSKHIQAWIWRTSLSADALAGVESISHDPDQVLNAKAKQPSRGKVWRQNEFTIRDAQDIEQTVLWSLPFCSVELSDEKVDLRLSSSIHISSSACFRFSTAKLAIR
ncbi:hypothetical protein MRB53_039569 [Persea americana]|nr:hypothetical protein MRB53_039569 [Persea americana]